MTKASVKKGLGRGLGAFFDDVSVPDQVKPVSESGKYDEKISSLILKVRDIEPNPNQPRKNFDKEKLEELADSIAQHGLIQPILVEKTDDGMYRIIAGERRWRAAKLAGVKEVPCVLREYSQREIMEIALIENLQREDLNPIEEAEGYQNLIKTFSLTQEEVAERVGKSRSAVANSLRLNGLSDKMKKLVLSGQLSQGHARALLGVSDEKTRYEMAQKIISEGLTVRQTEKMVQAAMNKKPTPKKIPDKNLENYFKNLSQELSLKLETKVSVKYGKKRGKIEIEYYGNEQLEKIIKKLK